MASHSLKRQKQELMLEVYPSTRVLFNQGVLRRLQTLNSLLVSSVHESALLRHANSKKGKWPIILSGWLASQLCWACLLLPIWALVLEMGLLNLLQELSSHAASSVFPSGSIHL